MLADGWANFQRNGSGPIQANVTRFPSGMKAVADYVHARGEASQLALSCCAFPRLLLLHAGLKHAGLKPGIRDADLKRRTHSFKAL
jgi:hypothetical protein